jgi:hypothetical protein|eukprot:COSAG01_NODE_784_length_13621_cov_68.866829_10_plen_164_part_00
MMEMPMVAHFLKLASTASCCGKGAQPTTRPPSHTSSAPRKAGGRCRSMLCTYAVWHAKAESTHHVRVLDVDLGKVALCAVRMVFQSCEAFKDTLVPNSEQPPVHGQCLVAAPASRRRRSARSAPHRPRSGCRSTGGGRHRSPGHDKAGQRHQPGTWPRVWKTR